MAKTRRHLELPPADDSMLAAEVEQILLHFDENRNGFINEQEFLRMLMVEPWQVPP